MRPCFLLFSNFSVDFYLYFLLVYFASGDGRLVVSTEIFVYFSLAIIIFIFSSLLLFFFWFGKIHYLKRQFKNLRRRNISLKSKIWN